MPAFLLPLLLKNWKLVAHVAIYAGLALTIWYLHTELGACRATVIAFKLVQKQNEVLITDQNKAIGKMKTNEAKQEKASIVSAGILSRAIEASQKPVVFKPHSTCDADVRTVFEKLRDHK